MEIDGLLAAAAIPLLAVAVAGCNGGRNGTGGDGASAKAGVARTAPQARFVPLKKDFEGDSDDPAGSYYDSDDYEISSFGHTASAGEQQAIVSLVDHYYAAVVRGDGKSACRLLYPVLGEVVPENFGSLPSVHGRPCPVVLSWYFKHLHRRVKAESARLVVAAAARVEGDRGYALVGPRGTRPISDIRLHRYGGAWTINAILYETLP